MIGKGGRHERPLFLRAFCECEGEERKACIEALRAAAIQAHAHGIQVNAGHGLTVENLPDLFPVPHLHTLNIGHSLVCRAVMVGMKTAVEEMLAVMKTYTGGITQ